MRNTPKKFVSLLLTLVMALSLVAPAAAAETGDILPDVTTPAVTDPTVTDPTVTDPTVTDPTFTDPTVTDPTVTDPTVTDPTVTEPIQPALTIQDAISLLLDASGLTEEQLGDYPDDYNALAMSLGMIDGSEDLDAAYSEEQLAKMQAIADELSAAVKAEKLEPLFLNGMAQPIFPYTSGAVEEGYNNAESDIIRFFVYVETNYDTDDDGKLDLVKALVQIPRAAAEGNYQAATIYEARPYITGCTPFWGDGSGMYGTEGYDIEKMYTQPAPRGITGEPIDSWESAKSFVNAADSSEWYYWNKYEGMYDYEDLDWYDYYLVRGYAVVECGGLGTLGSDGFETCGTDLEIDAFKCVIEWLNGAEGRVAYTDKEGTTAIDAYWSNGKVGMTGRSYAGTTQFGLATTGVEGLETIVPVAGIASWYDYTNSQGISTNRNPAYSDTLALYCAGRYLDQEDYATIAEKYGNYLYQLQQDQLALNGDYGEHWAVRDYTLDAENIKCSALIVHGLSDYNVRPKNFDLMYQAFEEAGADVKLLLHQDGHLTPTYPSQGISFLVDDQSYDEILNKWFSHYLYGVENGIEEMAEVTAQDSHANTWSTYDSWTTDETLTLDADAAEETTTISSNHSAIGVTSRNWQQTFASGSTLSSAMYVADVTEDTIIKGSVAVSFSAATANEETAAAPRGAATDVDHDNLVDPSTLDHDSFIDPIVNSTDDVLTVSIPDAELIDRDALMVSAMLVDISDEAFPVFNTSGSYVPKTTLSEGSVWFGGGLEKFDLVEMNTTNVNYKIITRGWMDLCNPGAGYDSASASTKVNLEEGKYYDYTIYLQPNLYEVEAGHKLALVIYTYEPSMASYSQNYTVTLDNATVSASIPVDQAPATASVTAAYQAVKPVNLAVSAQEGGSVVSSVENGAVEAGTTVTVTATANEGYTFAGWTVNGKDSGTASPATFTVSVDTTIVANFTKDAEESGSSGSSVSRYTLTFNTNGGSTVSKVTKAQGTTIDLSTYTTSKDGCTFAGWYADEALTEAVTSVKLTGNVTVYAKWTEDAVSFTDVDNRDWFYDAVEYVSSNGIMKGVSETVFAPENDTTRGMIVTMLYRMEGEPAVTAASPFADVAAGQYYADAVAWAAANGIVTGTSETTFAPNVNITREQLSAILYRYAQYKGYDVSVGEDTNILSYADALSVSAYAVPAMQWACGAGIINGIGNSLVPTGNATRAQVATMLMRFAENVAK